MAGYDGKTCMVALLWHHNLIKGKESTLLQLNHYTFLIWFCQVLNKELTRATFIPEEGKWVINTSFPVIEIVLDYGSHVRRLAFLGLLCIKSLCYTSLERIHAFVCIGRLTFNNHNWSSLLILIESIEEDLWVELHRTFDWRKSNLHRTLRHVVLWLVEEVDPIQLFFVA